MKYIKKFEEYELLDEFIRYNLYPGIYITIKNNSEFSNKYNKFLQTHIAQIDQILGWYIYVHFLFNENDSKYVKNKFNHKLFHVSTIKLFAPTLEELKLKISAHKYNL